GRDRNATDDNPGGKGDRRPGSTSGPGGDGPAARPEKARPHRASVLQLEEFKKKVDKDILRKLKMSPEQFEQFLKDYADLVRRPAGQRPGEGPGPLDRHGDPAEHPGQGGQADRHGPLRRPGQRRPAEAAPGLPRRAVGAAAAAVAAGLTRS